jgi:hypothetical protein
MKREVPTEIVEGWTKERLAAEGWEVDIAGLLAEQSSCVFFGAVLRRRFKRASVCSQHAFFI